MKHSNSRPLPDRVVRYRCTSGTCRQAQLKEIGEIHDLVAEGHLKALEAAGCARCGCKRLEVWDTGPGGRGHLIVDWRSQKSLRKRGLKVTAALAERSTARARRMFGRRRAA